jgi:hypothetical protein
MNRRYYPCEICKKPIDFKTAKSEELMWEFEGEGVAHTACVPDDSEKWETTADVMMACDIDDELMNKINRYREKHSQKR